MKIADAFDGGYGMVVHVGAGACTELNTYLKADIGRIILVEPNPDYAQKLRAAGHAASRVEVMECAVARQSGTAELKILNVPDMSSLRKPTGLSRLYPRVAVRRTLPVNAITMDELLRNIAAGDSVSGMLVLDAPGEEKALAEAVARGKGKAAFSGVLFAGASEELYEDAGTVRDVKHVLEEMGYVIESVATADDADRPWWFARRDRLYVRVQALESDLAAAQKMQRGAETERDKAQSELKAAAEKAAWLRSTLEERDAALKSAGEKTAELSKALEDRDAALKAAEDKAEFLRKTLEERDAVLKAAGVKTAELSKTVEEREAALVSAEDKAVFLRKTLEEREAAVKAAEARLKETESELVKLRVSIDKQSAQIADQEARAKTQINRIGELEGKLNWNVGEREKLKQQADESKSRVEALQKRIAELEHKHALARGELRRAEGQVDLIKDLLFRENRL